jgi:ATP-grasp domain-containing protein
MNSAALDAFDVMLRSRTGLRVEVFCPSQEFHPDEMAFGVGRWHSGIRSLSELFRLVTEPDLALVFLYAPHIDPRIVDYLMSLPDQAAAAAARSRLVLVEVDDNSPRHLSEKFAERTELVARLRSTLATARQHGHTTVGLTGFAPSERLDALATAIGLPPATSQGSVMQTVEGKAAGRRLFRRLGVPHPAGSYTVTRDPRSTAAQIAALSNTHGLVPWLLKLDRGFGSGHGNALMTPSGPAFLNPGMTAEVFWRHAAENGLVIERLIEGRLRYPSVSLRLDAERRTVSVIATHEQIIDAQQGFAGAVAPADARDRREAAQLAELIGEELVGSGAGGYAGVDFLATEHDTLYALEVNLRRTGTSHADQTVAALLGAVCRDGELVAGAQLRPIHYSTTDSLINEGYRSITPARLIAGLRRDRELNFDRTRGTGVVPHLWTTMVPYGKLGATAIGGSAAECAALLARLTTMLERMTQADH